MAIDLISNTIGSDFVNTHKVMGSASRQHSVSVLLLLFFVVCCIACVWTDQQVKLKRTNTAQVMLQCPEVVGSASLADVGLTECGQNVRKDNVVSWNSM